MIVRALRGALLTGVLGLAGTPVVRAEAPLPAPPAAHFNDYAGVVPVAEAQRLDQKLADFEQQTSTQILVVIFGALPSPSLEDFTVRTAESWKVGQKARDNGAILFVFVDDRRLRIETGYGLEGALPDALAGRIIEERIKPRFREGDWTGGLEAGIDAMMSATRGEYSASPQERRGSRRLSPLVLVFFVVLLLVLSRLSGHSSARTYGSRGWRSRGHWGGGGWGGGGWSSGSGGGWGGGGGGFSGGGGSFGGGGASGNW